VTRGRQCDEGAAVERTVSGPAGVTGATAETPQWRKSRFSNPSGDCVEVVRFPDGEVGVRNSRDRTGPSLVFTAAELAAFVLGVKAGEFDDLIS